MVKQLDPRIHYLLALLRAMGIDPERVVMDSIKIDPDRPGRVDLRWQEFVGPEAPRVPRHATVTVDMAENPCQFVEVAEVRDARRRYVCTERTHHHG